MRVRAKREEDREMLISGGGAAAMLPSPTSRFMYFLHWVWEEIYDSAAPLCSCMCPPPTPAESQGCREMLGRYFFCPQPRTAREPMTADYGTSRSEAAIMRSLGFGWGIRVRGSTHTHSPGRGANLSSDHEVLVFLIVKIHVLRQRCYMDPAYGSAPCSSQLHRSGVCTIISPPWGYTIIDQSRAPSTLLPLLFILWRNPFSWLYHLTLITHHTLIKLLGTFITTSAQKKPVYSADPFA